MSDVIVIGGGFGGMASALRTRAKGHNVTLIERQKNLGGRARVFHKDGYHFDAGPTVITAPFLITELFDLFQKKASDYINLVPLNPWYQFYFQNGNTFNYGGTVEDTLEEIRKFSDKDCQGYLNLLKQSKEIFNIGFNKLASEPFHQILTMLKQAPHLLRLKSHQSVWKFVSKHISNEHLRQAFSIQPLLVGGNPFDTTCIYSLIHFLERKWGIYFAMGGTGAIVTALETLMTENGIRIITNETITKFEIKKKTITKVIAESGNTYKADKIISNLDPKYLYSHLIPKKQQSFSAQLKTQHSQLSMGLFVLYIGTNIKYPNIEHHTIWLGKRYKSLLHDIFKRKILAEDFSLYVHRPTATDNSFAPSGCDSFYILAPVPNLLGNINWSSEAKPYAEKIIKALEKTILPNLSRHIKVQFEMTPADFRSDYLSIGGSGFSIAPKFTQSAWFRYHNLGESIKNLYLVGAGTHPGAGLPGVLSSAKVVEKIFDSQCQGV